MAFLPESAIWEDGIYQLEETDQVLGGSEGISNLQGKQLANRTKYLLEQMGNVAFHMITLTSTGVLVEPENIVNKAIVILAAGNGRTVTLNDWELPEGTIVRINSYPTYPSADNYFSLVSASAIPFLGNFGTSYNLKLHTGESLTLLKTNEAFFLLNDNTGICDVGSTAFCYKLPMHSLELKGQLVQRNSFPRLFSFATDLGLITDTAWLADIKMCGRFSSGNGTTTFRLPDFRSMFVRGLDNGRGIDTSRVSGDPGTFENSNYETHTHSIPGIRKSLAMIGGPGSGYTWREFLTLETGTGTSSVILSTSPAGWDEHRPGNVGLIPYIKY